MVRSLVFLKVLVEHDSANGTLYHWVWLRLVMEFCTRAFSQPSDKLVACAGLADLFARALNTEYRAGLWCAHLRDGLLWHHAAGYLHRPPKYRAPSWSCASVDGEVNWAWDSYCKDAEGPAMREDILAEDCGATMSLDTASHIAIRAIHVLLTDSARPRIGQTVVQPPRAPVRDHH
ncbi:hypothetical protein GY45DRAFT_878470 [Cubamyces sp. BRFM 1775]|nr:hypothetical protein GY45DRAFT_878470 [Cubamyces sp. BRFM 1775]